MTPAARMMIKVAARVAPLDLAGSDGEATSRTWPRIERDQLRRDGPAGEEEEDRQPRFCSSLRNIARKRWRCVRKDGVVAPTHRRELLAPRCSCRNILGSSFGGMR